MSETEGDREYYAAAEAAFIRRRGTPFLLSPKDFALLKEWRALGVPIEAVERGIEDAFSGREERGVSGRVNSLGYCHDAVISAWERRAEVSVGRGSGRVFSDPDPASALDGLTASLEEVARRRPDLAGTVEPALRSLRRLRSSDKRAEEAEAALSRIDKKLAGALYAALPEQERDRVDARVAEAIDRSRARMDEATTEKTSRALTRRAVREMLELPRLSLL